MNGGYYTDSTTSAYSITISASASSASGVAKATGGSANASVTASSVEVGVGYNPSVLTISTNQSSTGNKTGNSAQTTEKTANQSVNKTIYLKPIEFRNEPTSGVTYTDITDTSPILIPGDYLYINSGFSENVKLSTAKLMPNLPEGLTIAPVDYILSGYSAFDEDANILIGTMPTIAATTYNTSASN
jgi:hypothetical protein